MSRRRLSLSRILYFHDVAFLAMLLLTGLVGIGLITVSNEALRQSRDLNRIAQDVEGLRGDFYQQVKTLFDYIFIGDPGALIEFEAFDQDIEARLDSLVDEPLGTSLAGTPTVTRELAELRRVYREVRNRVRAILNEPVSDFSAIQMMRIIETELEQGEMMQYQRAMTASQSLFDAAQQRLEARGRALVTGSALLLALPLLFGAGLLYLSRRFLRRQVVEPVDDLTRAVEALRSAGPSALAAPAAARAEPPVELLRLQEAFARMAAELEESQRARVAQEKQAAMGALVPVIAHNIRNPLASVRAAAQVMLAPDLAPATKANLEGIMRAVDRVTDWLSSLLSYLHPIALKSRATPLDDMVDSALLLLGHQLEERQIRVELGPIGEGILVQADRGLIEQAIGNLLMNAIEASPRGGLVAIGAEAAERTVELRIRDQGDGFHPKPLADPDRAVRSSKPGGYGLGLPFAQKILEVHGGRLAFSPADGPGTVAVVTLPLAPPG